MLNDIRNRVAVGVVSLGIAAFGTGCTKEAEVKGPIPANEVDPNAAIGTVGDMSLYLREIDGKTFLLAERHSAVDMVEHNPAVKVPNDRHTFASESCGQAGDHTLHKVTVDGVRYLLAEHHSSCELIPFPINQ